jgi:nicotinamidase-related amidase
VTKGSNPFTEHYSAIMADVPDPEDLSTQINTRFLEKVMKSDIILLAGEAKSHCLACTGEDAANYFKDDTKFIGKTVLLEDATSAVTGYESRGDEFVAKMVKRGMQRATTLDFMN